MQAEIASTSLHLAEEGPMDVATSSQCFLAEILGFTSLTDSLTEDLGGWGDWLGHAAKPIRPDYLCPESIRPMYLRPGTVLPYVGRERSSRVWRSPAFALARHHCRLAGRVRDLLRCVRAISTSHCPHFVRPECCCPQRPAMVQSSRRGLSARVADEMDATSSGGHAAWPASRRHRAYCSWPWWYLGA